MASYTNRRGERIHVSDEHIETAIRLKIELQKMSPSGKCNWNTHKKMMEQEGFLNSDTHEVYRIFIRAQQKSRGLLPDLAKYSDFVSDKKLESIKTMTGEMFQAKRATQLANRDLNKTKREIADELIVIDELKEAIGSIKIPKLNHDIVHGQGQAYGIVTPSDWHIGQIYNGVGYEVAKKRVEYYAKEVVRYSKSFNISTVYVTHLGDIINHVYMHKNTQAYHSEFTVAEQIVRATHLMFEFLNILGEHLNVYYIGTIVGNHGRMSAKGETLTNDNVEVVIHEMIKTMIETANEQNQHSNISVAIPEIMIYEKDYAVLKRMGQNIVFVHGDKEFRDGASRLKKYMSILNHPVDLLIQGHTHNFKVESENYGRKIITSGCLMGSDDYAENLGFRTNASQLFTVVDSKNIIPICIDFVNLK